MDNNCTYSNAIYNLYMEKSFGIEMCSTDNDIKSLSRQLFIDEYKEQYLLEKDLTCSETTIYTN